MIHPKLIEHIRSRLEQGATPEVIRSTILANGGWSEMDLDEAFNSLGVTSPQTPPTLEALRVTDETSQHIPQGFTPPITNEVGIAIPDSAPRGRRFLLPTLFFVAIIIVVLGGGYVLAKKFNLLSTRPYTESNFVMGLLSKTEEIRSVSYRITSSLVMTPREAGAVPFTLKISNEQDLREKYERDYNRVKDIGSILSSLRSKSGNYPRIIDEIFTGGYYYNTPSINDPKTGQKYQYSSTEGGKNFRLELEFETREAINQIRSITGKDSLNAFYPYSATGTQVVGNSVIFTKDSPTFLYISSSLPKPLILTLGEMATFLPSEMSASFSASAKTDWENGDGEFNVDATGNFGDLTYKINIDAIKKGTDYFMKINNFPSLFFPSIDSAKGQWIKISNNVEEVESSYNPLSFIAEQIEKLEEENKKRRLEVATLLKLAARIADEEKLIMFKSPPKRVRTGDDTLNVYEITLRKDALLPYMRRLSDEASSIMEIRNNPVILDENLIDYLESPEFNQVFDYMDQNTSLAIKVNDRGYPRVIEYRMRIVPPDTAINLKNKQGNLVFSLTFDDINKQIMVEAPKDTKPLKDIFSSSLSVAHSKGQNAKTKANLAGARAAAEIFFDSHSSYNGSSGNIMGLCTTANSMFTDKHMSPYADLSNYDNSVSMRCYSTNKSYAISASLVSEGDIFTHWCIDSNGNSKGRTSHVTSPSC